MKQFLYILLIPIIGGLVSCASNGDQPDPIVIPPTPEPVELTEDALIGTWETYYYTKSIRANPGTSSEVAYQGLRLIDYDGYETRLYKSGNIYRFTSKNVIKDIIDEGTYFVKDDTLKFVMKNKQGKDSISSTQKVFAFNPTQGILKVDIAYRGTNKNGVKYIVTDTKCQRNVEINPEFSDVNPPKVKIDFDNLSKGEWEIYAFAYYEGGSKNSIETKLGMDTLGGLTYRFYTDANGQQRCHRTQRIPGTDDWGEADNRIVIVDDVISFIEEKKDVSGSVKKQEDGGIFMWPKEWKLREGVESFIDWKEERFVDDISIIVRTEAFVRRKSE